MVKLWKQIEFYFNLKDGIYNSFGSLCCEVLTTLKDFQCEKFAWTCWSLWNRRNAFLHGNIIKSNAILLDSIACKHGEYKEAI